MKMFVSDISQGSYQGFIEMFYEATYSRIAGKVSLYFHIKEFIVDTDCCPITF